MAMRLAARSSVPASRIAMIYLTDEIELDRETARVAALEQQLCELVTAWEQDRSSLSAALAGGGAAA